MSNWWKKDKDIVWHPYTSLVTEKIPLAVKKAKGVYLHTEDGRKIIDGVSSWWVNILGHANPKIAKAIARQAKTLEHVIFAGFTHKPAVDLSEKLLTKIVPSTHSKVFFSDNGSTAVEVAIKMALQYWFNKGENRERVLAWDGAYHGDTFGTMSIGSPSAFNKPFQKKLYDVTFIPFPENGDEEYTIQAFTEEVKKGDVALFIFEPLIQGTSGMRMYSPQLLDKLMDIANEYGVICISDEVMTGFSRTGKTLAIDYLRNKPDIIAMSKGITGGFMPLGITTCSQKIENAFLDKDIYKTFFHGHSYTGNPLACAAANKSIDLLLSNKIQKKITDLVTSQKLFADKMSKNKKLKVRALGTVFAAELITESQTSYFSDIRDKLYDFFLQKDILLRPLGNIVYIMPPYTITKKELQKIYKTFEEAVQLFEENNL